MLNFLHTKNLNIEDQLKIEKDLLDNDTNNWCIINEGSEKRIVLGVNSKEKDDLNLDIIKKDNIKTIKRFSGGGTVFVDKDTIFITFIFSKKNTPDHIYPEPIMRFLEEIYIEAFPIKDFRLLENDFVIKNKKCGGNAQHIKKDRWLHHTSFLWKYDKKNMSYLLHPLKTPNYRNNRPHDNFLDQLSNHLKSKSTFINSLKDCLKKRYKLNEITLESLMK